MIRNQAKLKFAAALFAALALVFAGLTPANATHLRGAVGTMTYSASAKTVTLTSTLVERKDACTIYSSSNSLCTYFAFPTISQVNRTTGAVAATVKACTGQATSPATSVYDNTSQPLYNIFTTTYVIDVSCPSFNTDFDYTFSQLGNNRIGGIKNSTNQTIQFEGKIRINGTNDAKAPIYNSGYMTNVPYNTSTTAVFTTNLNALEGLAGKSVTYSLVTSQASGLGGYGGSKIPCSDLNLSTGEFKISAGLCVGSENYVTAFSGGTPAAPIYYVLKTKATDALGQYTTRDVLLAFASQSDNAPTLTRVTSSAGVTVTPGTPQTITYTASDVDAGQIITWSTNTLPSWATFTGGATTGSSTPRTSTATLVLNPPSGTNTALSVLVSAQDNATFPLSVTNRLDVTVGSALLPPGAPGITTVGSTGTITFTAPTAGGTVASYSATATNLTTGAVVNGTCVTSPSFSCTFSGVNNTGYSFVVTATNASGSASSSPWSPSAPILAISPASRTIATGTALPSPSYTITATGAPVSSYSAAWSTTPAGVVFNTSTGLISGTPTTPGTYTLTITGTSATGSTGTVTFTLTVSAAAQTVTWLPFGAHPMTSLTPNATAGVNGISNNEQLVPLRAYSSVPGATITFSNESGSWCQMVVLSGITYGSYTFRTGKTSTQSCSYGATASAIGNYAASTKVLQTLSINRNDASVTDTNQKLWTSVGAQGTLPAGGVPQIATFTSPDFASGTSTLSYPVGTVLNSPLRYTLTSNTYAPTYCSLSPSLPAGIGITFDTHLCQLVGTVSAVTASASYTITYKNPSGAVTYPSRTFNFGTTINTQTITFAQPANMIVGGSTQAISARSTSGLTVAFSNDTTDKCAISGTSTSAGVTTATITASAAGTCTIRAVQVGNSSYSAATAVVRSLTVSAALPAPAIAAAISGTEDAQRMVFEYSGSIFPLVSTGGTVASYQFLNAAGTANAVIPAGLAFDSTTGILSGAAENSQTRTHYVIKATNTSGTSTIDIYLTITKMDQIISFPAVSSMVFADAAGSGQGLGAVSDSGMAITYSIDAADVANCDLLTGGIVRPKAGLTGIGHLRCRVIASQAGDSMMYNPAVSVAQIFYIESGLLAPNITLTHSTGYMVVGQPFTLPFEVINTGGAVPVSGVALGTGNQFTVSGSSLPAGLVFSNYYGTYISGSPTAMGTYTLTITATNSAGSSSAQFVLTVGKQPQTVTVTTGANLTVGAADATLTSTTTATGLNAFTYSVDVTSDPGACSIVAGKVHALAYGTCVIRSSQAGDTTYEPAFGLVTVQIHKSPTLQVSGVTGAASSSITLTVTNGQRVIAGLYNLITTGDPATSFYLKDTSGAAVNISATNLAANGLDQFDSVTGYITGTASTNTGSDSIRIYISNGYSPDVYVTVTFNYTGASQPNLTIPNSNIVTYIYNVIPDAPYLVVNTGSDVQACDGAALYSYTTLTGTLPAGVSFNRCTGLIEGTPTALQSSPVTYSFKGINSTGSAGTSATFTLTVLPCVPVIAWADPNSIAYGTTLSGALNPSASCGTQSSVPGTYEYTSTINGTSSLATSSTVLLPGTYTLGTTLTPSTGNFASGQTASVQLTVTKCTPTITWGGISSITYGTALSSTQLNATASCNGVDLSNSGTFVYKSYGQTLQSGDILIAGANLLLTVTFVPTNSTLYNDATGSNTITVLKRAAVIRPIAGSKAWSGSSATDPALTFEAVSGLLVNQDEIQKISAIVSRATGESVGTYLMSIGSISSDFYTVTVSSDVIDFTITSRTPTIALASTITKPVGATVVTTATSNLSGVTWSIDSPGSGFSINSAGLLSFTSAATAGTYTVIIRALDGSGGFATATIVITVLASGGTTPDLSLDNSAFVLTVGTPIDASTTYLISNLGSAVDAGGYQLASGSMPAGLSFSATTGQVSGTPTAAQAQTTYTFTGKTGSNVSSAVTFKLTINKCQTVTTWSTPANIVYGTALSSTQINAVAKCGTTTIPGAFTYTDEDGEPIVDGAIHQVGVNHFSVVFVPTDTANYLGSSASTTLTVTKKPIVVVISDAQKRKGSSDPVYVWDSNGVVYAGDVSNLPITVTRTDLSEEIGSYVLTGSAGTSDNYTITFDSTAKHLTITNNQPVITSARTATITAPSQAALDLNADVTVVWTIVGGGSQSMFAIDANTGVLSFVAPTSAGTYDVVIRATDTFGGFYEFTVTITVLAQALPDAPSGGGSAPVIKIILKTPKPITTGKPAEKTEVKVTAESGNSGSTPTPSPTPNATVLSVIVKNLPTEIQNAKIVEGVVVMQTQAGFTGVVEVPVEVKLDSGEIQQTTTKVTVNPEAPTAVVVEETKPTQNVITWAAASGAVEYEVTVNGTSVGTTAATTYTLNIALAADAKIMVSSLGRMSTASEAVPALVKKAALVYTLFKTVDHFAKSSSALTSAMKKILDKAIIAIKKLGYKTLAIEGHADGQAAAANVFSKVSIARATAVKNYLAPKLPGVKMSVRGLGKDLPVASNKTVEGQAKNRRATIFATTK